MATRSLGIGEAITKSVTLTDMKLLQDDPHGTFEAVVSVFGNVDLVGDVVIPGAFKRTLTENGLPPIGWMHNSDVPPIGVAVDAKETSEGLWVKGRLFVDEDAGHDLARQVYAGMKAGAIRQFSFGYEIKDAAWETVDGTEVRLLKDLDLIEVSPVWIGANPRTRLAAVKAADTNDHDPGDTGSVSSGDHTAGGPLLVPADLAWRGDLLVANEHDPTQWDGGRA